MAYCDLDLLRASGMSKSGRSSFSVYGLTGFGASGRRASGFHGGAFGSWVLYRALQILFVESRTPKQMQTLYPWTGNPTLTPTTSLNPQPYPYWSMYLGPELPS